jgi:peptidyl-prolyl cis-trans isomerase D
MARKRFRNATVAVILFLSLVAIVITGFGTGGSGLGDLGGGSAPTSEELAKVGSRAITASEANDQFNQSYQITRERLPNLQMPEYLNQGGFEGAVDQLIALEAMRQYGEARGIAATRRMVDRVIANIPAFHNAAGQYDHNLFLQVLQQRSLSEAQVRQDIVRVLMQRQLIEPIQSGFRVPEGVAKAYATVPLEQRTGMIGVVPAAGIAQGLNPSAAEVAQYYQRYRASFSVPERRVIKYAVIGADQVTAAAPTEAEIRAVYANTPRYQQSETRTLQSITFSGAQAQQQAAAFAQRVRGGTPFLDAARAAGFQDSDVTFANQSQARFAGVTSADVSAQAFRAPQGGLVGPVRSPLGVHVVRVASMATSSGRPLEAVRADIVRELERRKRSAAIVALATQVEQQLDEGTSFEDAARAARLTIVTTPPITAQGMQTDGRPWAELSADLRPLLPAVFDMDPDSPDPVVAPIQENARYALIGVDRTEPAAPPPLAQIQGRVRDMLIRRTALARARQIADGIAARINAGTPMAQAFAQAGIPLPPPQSITARRQDIMRSQQPPAALVLFFRLRPGTAEVVAAPNNGGWMIAAPQQSIRGTEAAAVQGVASIRQELSQSAPLEAERQLLRAMELSVGVQRNESAIRAERRRIAANIGAAP